MKYYAIRKGRKTGIFNSWTETCKFVTGYKGAEFKSFTCLKEAQDYSLSSPCGSSQSPSTDNLSIKEDALTEEEEINIYTDGACRANGKQNAVAGYGIFYGLNDPRNISKKLSGSIQTNNRAELMGVIEALQRLKPEIKANIYTDSQYVQKGLESWISNWKKRNWTTSTGNAVLNQDLWKILDEIKRKRPFARVVYVKGHSGNLGNEMADKLAVEGCFKRLE